MDIQRRKPLTANVGLFAVGHHTYWKQYEGLLDELMGYHGEIKEKIESHSVTVTDFGMTDDAQTAYAMVRRIKAADLDLVFCNMSTYATSSTWGIIVRELDVPIILVALQPDTNILEGDYCTHKQLANDEICAVPEFMGVAVRMGKKVPPIVIGTLHDDAEAEAELGEWCRIGHVLHDLKGARIGQMGHTLEAMLDMHSDHSMFTAHFGLHIVQTEAEDVMQHYRDVTDKDVELKKRDLLEFFDTPDPVSDPDTLKLTDEHLDTAARVAVALDRFIQEKQLDGLAYYYEAEAGSEMRKLVTNFIVGNSLLCAAGFPMCGENDLKTCVAMLIMDRLNIGGSFAEFHPINFKDNFIYVGHDGPHHLNICEGRPVLRSLLQYHGKPGSGASVEFKIKEGPVTMLGLAQTYDGKFKFILAEGESVAGLIPPTGNTNTSVFFEPDLMTFLKRWFAQGPTHHYALGIGHHARTIHKLSYVLGIESVIVTPVDEKYQGIPWEVSGGSTQS